MNKFESWVQAILFITAVTVPVIIFGTGHRPEIGQNRTPTPRPTLSASGFLDRELTPQLDDYLEDALFITPEATKVVSRLYLAAGVSPSPLVALGEDDWLFYTNSLEQPCLSEPQLAAYADTLLRAKRAVGATGRQLLTAIAPDKASIFPDRLGSQTDIGCVLSNAENLHSLAETTGIVTVWDELRDQRPSGELLYLHKDTHWTHLGASIMASAIVDTLSPGSWDDSATGVVEIIEHEGDLTVMIAFRSIELMDTMASRVDGLHTEVETEIVIESETHPIIKEHFTTTGNTPIKSKTLVIHDSFGRGLTRLVAPYFQDITFIERAHPATDVSIASLLEAETIIHVRVQRDITAEFIHRDMAAQFVSVYADSYEQWGSGTIDGQTAVSMPLPLPPDADNYAVIDLPEGSPPVQVSVGTRTLIAAPHQPKPAFLINDTSVLTATGHVNYYLVSIPHEVAGLS